MIASRTGERCVEHVLMPSHSDTAVNDIWEAYGAFLIEYTMAMGWDELLRTLSGTLRVSTFVKNRVQLPIKGLSRQFGRVALFHRQRGVWWR